MITLRRRTLEGAGTQYFRSRDREAHDTIFDPGLRALVRERVLLHTALTARGWILTGSVETWRWEWPPSRSVQVTPPGAVRHVVTAIVERPSTRRIDVLVVGEEEPRAMRLSSGQLTRVLDVIEDHRFHSSFSLTELIDPFGATETR